MLPNFDASDVHLHQPRHCISAHLAPDDSVLGALLQGLGLVDVGHPLAQVEVDLLLALHAVDLDQRRRVVLVPQAPALTRCKAGLR